jgi:DNA-binding MarR family transcriptional regulator
MVMTMRTLLLDAFLPFRLSVTSNLVSGRIAEAYESLFGLTIPEWRLIAVIAEENPITQQAICARTRMDKVTVSRAAIALAGRKLIMRKENPADKRSQLLSLTATGHELYASIAPKALEMEEAAFATLSDAERHTLMGLLVRIDSALEPKGQGGS